MLQRVTNHNNKNLVRERGSVSKHHLSSFNHFSINVINNAFTEREISQHFVCKQQIGFEINKKKKLYKIQFSLLYDHSSPFSNKNSEVKSTQRMYIRSLETKCNHLNHILQNENTDLE